MKPCNPDDRKIVNIREADYTPWMLDNGQLDSSSSALQFNTSKPNGVGFHIYKMESGSTTLFFFAHLWASDAASFCFSASSSVANRFILILLDFSNRSLFRFKLVGYWGRSNQNKKGVRSLIYDSVLAILPV